MKNGKVQRVSMTVARAYADEAKREILNQRDKEMKKNVPLAKASKEFAQIVELNKKIDHMEERRDWLIETLKEKYNVTTWNSGRSISNKMAERGDLAGMKEAVILANQIDGVPPEKLIDHIIKKFTAK